MPVQAGGRHVGELCLEVRGGQLPVPRKAPTIRSRTGWSSSSALFTRRVSISICGTIPAVGESGALAGPAEHAKRITERRSGGGRGARPAIVEVLAGFIVVWLAVRMRAGASDTRLAAGCRRRPRCAVTRPSKRPNKAPALRWPGQAVPSGGLRCPRRGPAQAPVRGLRLRRRGSLPRLLPPRRGDGRQSLPIRSVSTHGYPPRSSQEADRLKGPGPVAVRAQG